MLNCFCASRHLSQWKRMSMALDRFGIILPVVRPWAVLLLVIKGVGGCGWPISSSITWRGTASQAL
eukprot:14233054-Ditylum_brightwellii.AAC.1